MDVKGVVVIFRNECLTFQKNMISLSLNISRTQFSHFHIQFFNVKYTQKKKMRNIRKK